MHNYTPWLLGCSLMAAVATEIQADKIQIFNGYKEPLYVALVQIKDGKVYDEMVISSLADRRGVTFFTDRSGIAPAYQIPSYNSVLAERPSRGALTVAKDTELLYSASLNSLTSVIAGTSPLPVRKGAVNPSSGVGRYKVGQVGNKKVYLYEDGTLSGLYGMDEASFKSNGLKATTTVSKMAKLILPSKAKTIAQWPVSSSEMISLTIGSPSTAQS